MKKMHVNLENCYGIRKIDKEFDFSKDNTFVVYSPNGTMKTSFTKVFQKFQAGKSSDVKDHLFNKEPVIKSIQIDNTDIKKEDIYTIRSFESTFESKNMASLLIADSLKEKLNDILTEKKNFLKNIAKVSGLKIEKTKQGKKFSELEDFLVRDFEIESFFQDLDKFDLTQKSDFLGIEYQDIFDNSVLKKIKSIDFQNNIEAFLNKSDEIYKNYSFLSKGIFSLGKLKDVSVKLACNNFFEGGNEISLGGIDDSIMSIDDLNFQIMKVETELKDTDEFKKIEELLNDSKGIALKDILEKNPEIIPELKETRLSELRKKLWISYFNEFKDDFFKLKVNLNKLNLEKESKSFDETPWAKAYKIFKDRFTVPFDMKIENIKSSVFGEVPKVIFRFCENYDDTSSKCLGEWISKNRDFIEEDILSQGEKRALYLLNIIFDIEFFKEQLRAGVIDKKIFIIDDIADSFDYKNKYAIIEYLRDISDFDISKQQDKKVTPFYSIILTHNFDFYRTTASRLKINTENRLHYSRKKVEKTDEFEIDLIVEKYQGDPFKIWKEDLSEINIIALIPFVRNLIEFGKDNKNDFTFLTHLLHVKNSLYYDKNGSRIRVQEGNLVKGPPESLVIVRPYSEEDGDFSIKKSLDINFSDLKPLYLKYLGTDSFNEDVEGNISVLDRIKTIAESVEDSRLENKLILAISIRIEAEKFMINKIHNTNTINAIKQNQTSELISKFKGNITAGNITSIPKEVLSFLDSVNIITPENIHINSFMYEPLLDMDIVELQKIHNIAIELNT